MRMKSLMLIFTLGMALSFAKVANATLVDIAGKGTWNANTPTSPFSAPNETWAFSFDLPQSFSPSGIGTPVTQFSNFNYLLNGSLVSSPTLSSVEFYTPNIDGISFVLAFDTGDTVALFGPDVGTSGTLSLGTFTAPITMNDKFQETGNGIVTLSIPSATPEPSPLALFGTGIFLLGYMAYRKKELLKKA